MLVFNNSVRDDRVGAGLDEDGGKGVGSTYISKVKLRGFTDRLDFEKSQGSLQVFWPK